MDKCTGCGFCLGRCPTQAIDFRVMELQGQPQGIASTV